MSENNKLRSAKEIIEIFKSPAITKIKSLIDKQEQIFNQDVIAEAYIGLYGIIEAQLSILWKIFLVKTLKRKFKPISDYYDPLTYSKILYQSYVINKIQKDYLIAFHQGRNSVVHFSSNIRSGKHPDKPEFHFPFFHFTSTVRVQYRSVACTCFLSVE